jgi:prolyl oligopeptidase
MLSDGGQDAVEIREFDTVSRRFVEDGFRLPAGRSDVAWVNADEVLFVHAFGATDVTASKYGNTLRRWRRGTRIEEAAILYRGNVKNVGVFLADFHVPGGDYLLMKEFTGFRESIKFWIDSGVLKPLDIPRSARVEGVFSGQVVVNLRDDWKQSGREFKGGSYISFPFGSPEQAQSIVEPDAQATIDGWTQNRDSLFIKTLRNVQSRLLEAKWDGRAWRKTELRIPRFGNLSFSRTDPFGTDVFATFESFLVPLSVHRIDDGKFGRLYAPPAMFNGERFLIEQLWAASADGVRIPYFVIRPKRIALNHSHPALMYGYGAGNVSILPFYLGEIGAIWLQKGGIYVSANIRGGGEFGPAWYRAALKENKVRSFEDFEAVADDLVRRGYTAPRRLAVTGGSWGGLLTSAVATRKPEKFGAVVSKVPMTDMIRYPLLGVGASWVSEFGDPADAEARKALRQYSPYHNVYEGKKYPPILFLGSTNEDRCGPGHWRKMAARLRETGSKVMLFEKLEGGHGAGADPEERAYERAREFTFIRQQLLAH